MKTELAFPFTGNGPGPATLPQEALLKHPLGRKLYYAACKARKHGEKLRKQYRNFYVGCALLAYSEKAVSYRIFTGYNTKPKKNVKKKCAEVRAFEAAVKAGFTEAVSMVVVGLPQMDAGSKKHTLTLHCCPECRAFLVKHPLMKPDVPIVSATPPEEAPFIGESYTFMELLLYHKI